VIKSGFSVKKGDKKWIFCKKRVIKAYFVQKNKVLSKKSELLLQKMLR